jgi:uncharacterized protein (TIGR02996 family)
MKQAQAQVGDGILMNPEDAFLQAILDAADDDAPRLVYADWLEEHGQPDRAAFIRVQCELARLPEGDPRRPVLEARERALLAHQDQWLGPLNSPLLHWQFRRGFVEGFSHAGLFKSTEPVLEVEDDPEPRNYWSYLRFYADRRVLSAVSNETSAEVARWLEEGHDESSAGRYTARPAHPAVELSFSL